jgi:hypothetical protein
MGSREVSCCCVCVVQPGSWLRLFAASSHWGVDCFLRVCIFVAAAKELAAAFSACQVMGVGLLLFVYVCAKLPVLHN